jgi:mono/diheme cytochrome c family protein
MKSRHIRTPVLVIVMMGICGFAMAAEKERIDPGKQEYLNRCSTCHGQSGKGDGGLMDLLKKAPSDLTVLSKKNGGVFPFDRVYAVIDGREAVKGHGDREMPIWGREYRAETVRAAAYYVDVSYDMESYVRARILALIDYLNRLQST